MNPIAWAAKALGIDAFFVKLGLAGLMVIGLGIATCSIKNSIIKSHDAAISTKTLKTDAVAKEDAATQRADDTAAITKAEEERNDEIRKAPDSKPAAARNRLNCDRMRRQGTDTSGFPECR